MTKTVKIVRYGCDLYPIGSYQEVEELITHPDLLFLAKVNDCFHVTWSKDSEIPEETKECPACENTFDIDHEFKEGNCIRCYHRKNTVGPRPEGV